MNPLDCRRDRLRSRLRDHPRDVGEQVPWNGHLGQPEGDAAAMADDLHANFDHRILWAMMKTGECFRTEMFAKA